MPVHGCFGLGEKQSAPTDSSKQALHLHTTVQHFEVAQAPTGLSTSELSDHRLLYDWGHYMQKACLTTNDYLTVQICTPLLWSLASRMEIY